MKHIMKVLVGILDFLIIIFATLLTGCHAIFIILQMIVEFFDKLVVLLAKWVLNDAPKKETDPEHSKLLSDIKSLPEYIITPIESVLLHKLLRYYLINKISLVRAVQCFTAALTGNTKLTDDIITELKLNADAKDVLFKLFIRINRWEYIKDYTLPISIKVRLSKANLNDSEFIHACDACRNMFMTLDITDIKYSWTDPDITGSLISYFSDAHISTFDDTLRSNMVYYNSRI